MLFPISVIEESGSGLRSYNLADKLYEQNIILLEHEIDDDIATLVKAQLIYLDSKEDCKEINLHISSYGGSVYAGLGIIDIIKHIKTPVNTICTGVAMSMGLAILSSGTGTRSALPNSRLMAHSISGGFKGKFQDMEIDFNESKYLQEKLMRLMADNTKGKTSYDEMVKLCERDKFLSPEEAIEIGFIDKVL